MQFYQKWLSATTDNTRYYIDRVRFVHYDRIVAIDADGDTVNPGPHLYVEFDRVNGPFEPRELLVATPETALGGQSIKLDPANKVKVFDATPPEGNPTAQQATG